MHGRYVLEYCLLSQIYLCLIHTWQVQLSNGRIIGCGWCCCYCLELVIGVSRQIEYD